jgi:hypothetical protein
MNVQRVVVPHPTDMLSRVAPRYDVTIAAAAVRCARPCRKQVPADVREEIWLQLPPWGLVTLQNQTSSTGQSLLEADSRPGDRLCGLVVRVPGCKPRGPRFDSRNYQIFCVAVGLERDPLSLVRINEEQLERKVAGSV